MNRILWTAVRFAAAALVLWGTARASGFLEANRVITAMMLLLEVLAIATLGDWILALLSSMVASLAFSFYFIDEAGSFRLTTIEGSATFAAMALTALTGSRLSVLAQRRAREAIVRREEMERLNQLGRVLLSSNSLAEASQDAVRNVVELFGLEGAVLRVAGAPHAFQSGSTATGRVSVIPLHTDYGADVLELHGMQPS